MSTDECPHCGEAIPEHEEACAACGHLHVSKTCEVHTHREADGQCVVCGTALCEECNNPQGRHFVCGVHCEIPLISGWAQVYSAGDDVDAELVRENLNAEGIDSRVLSQRDHNAFPVDMGELNEVRVLVPAYEYEAAAELIEDHRNRSGDISFGCPNCGEAYDAGESICTSCGASLPTVA